MQAQQILPLLWRTCTKVCLTDFTNLIVVFRTLDSGNNTNIFSKASKKARAIFQEVTLLI